MQNAMLAIVVGASLLGLTMMTAIITRHQRGHVAMKIALGGVVGTLGAAIALILRIDFVPDQIELISATLLIIGIATIVIVAIAYRYR
ncbi:MAG TPA: hypothetical protein VHG52_04890 [Thermomicrobiales bacterium]|nr:hypothetical protein [Thermomicrobiales bacterium]